MTTTKKTRTKTAARIPLTGAALIDKAAIGVEASWGFGDGDAEAVTLPREEVRDILKARGYDVDLIPEITADHALRKAAQTAKGRSKEIVIQELRRPNTDTARAFGVYRVTGKDGESGDNVEMRARARVQSDQVVCLPPEGESAFTDADCERVGNEIARISNSLIDNVLNRDLSDMLVTIGWASGWISRRRNSGGVYFIANDATAERYVGLLKDLQGLTAHAARDHQFVPQVMEVYPKPLTMDMWKGSAADQYEAQTEQLIKDLKAMQGSGGEKMRESTVQARADECDRLMKMAEGHRLFLEGAVDTITAELARIRDGFTKRLTDNAKEAKDAFDAIADDKAEKKAAKKAGKNGSKKATKTAPKKTAAKKKAAPKGDVKDAFAAIEKGA